MTAAFCEAGNRLAWMFVLVFQVYEERCIEDGSGGVTSIEGKAVINNIL